MRVFYNATTTNFGDHLNTWLWPKLIPELLERHDDNVLVGVGSLLKADLNRIDGRKYIVGTGSGYGPPPSVDLTSDWNVSFVRGPLTAKMFGFDSATAIGDGAWLIDLLEEYQKPKVRESRIVFIPHWTSAQYGDWQKLTNICNIEYINPLDDGPSVLHRISTAGLAIVESLHGAIFADYFRTPWIPVSSAGRVLHFKWLDWCMSLGMKHFSYPLPPSDYVDFLLQGQRPNKLLPELKSFYYNPEMFNYEPIRHELSASRSYAMKIKAKQYARGLRRAALERVETHRNAVLFRSWNAEYEEQLVSYFEQLKKLPGRLSEDCERSSVLDRMADAFQRFLLSV